MNVIENLQGTARWVQSDFKSNPWRLLGEVYGWVITLASAIIFAFTVPNVPFHVVYPAWISAVLVLTFCGISRGSFGLTMLNLSMLIFDVVGYARLLMGSN